MIYPEFLKVGDTIGVCAPSDGVTEVGKLKRLAFAHENFREIGFKIKETESVRKSVKGKSTTSEVQAKELESLYLDKNVKAIICAAGGDFLLEMLSFVDFDIIKNNVKWLQGYSDPTGILFLITTNFDIATIYGNNFTAFGMRPWHKSLKDNVEILQGNIIEQRSFERFESGHVTYIKGDEAYLLDSEVKWDILDNRESVELKGRIIGGCIDILTEIFGTRFDKTKDFIEKYKNDGIIWYFDNCELTSEGLIRTLWKFKDSGWFKHCKGIIFGRSALEASYYDISFREAISYALKEIDVPIIVDADIGHVSPRFTIINGALVNIKCSNHKGEVKFILN